MYAEGQGQDGLLDDEHIAIDFSVRDPVMQGKHMVYTVRGRDLQGPFDCKRRFNEFFTLDESLSKRWPGIVLPHLPPKKAINNKDAAFINERRFYLERYLRKLARFSFLIESVEF